MKVAACLFCNRKHKATCKGERNHELKRTQFLKLMDYTPEEILYLIDLAADLKSKKKQGILHDSLIGKNIALIF